MMRFRTWLPVMAAGLVWGQSALADAGRPPLFTASAWEAADQLFRGDDQWVGGDGAYSIDLGQGRVLWLFGDSFIDPSGAGSRKSPGTTMISNSLAVQTGYDPSDAGIRFFWARDDAGAPQAFFADRDDYRFWPGHGIKLGPRLVLFLMKVRSVATGLGFEVFDWSAVSIENPQADPDRWEWEWLDRPECQRPIIVGSAGVLVQKESVYAFGSEEPDGHRAYLVRWPRAELLSGHLQSMAWWAQGTWSSRPSSPVLHDVPTEFTVHRQGDVYVLIQTRGFGAATIVMRTAEAITGPWSPARVVYEPPEANHPEALIYQGKAHPHLTGADLVLTYSTNHRDFAGLVADETLYFPRFVRLMRAR